MTRAVAGIPAEESLALRERGLGGRRRPLAVIPKGAEPERRLPNG
jgi:hypothetical protein